ncbi:MAG: polysaccharide deacetylase family protein [Bdellovibrionales bacterium]|nr:polysaccharide deacetylase family protein [Bdellovibrionales bacterium]
MKIKFKFLLSKQNNVFITFDDGPDPEITPIILETLKKNNIKATFFLIGKDIINYPDLTQEIINNGHEVGEHSFEHYHPWKMNIIRYFNDLYKSHQIFKQIYTDNPQLSKLYRPPYGKFNIITFLYLIISRKKSIFWNLDTKDYNASSSNDILRIVKDNLSPGSIILMHDGNPDKTIKHIHTASAVEDIISFIKSRNLKISTISKIYSKNN